MGFYMASLVPFPEFLADRRCFYSQRERSFYCTKVRYHLNRVTGAAFRTRVGAPMKEIARAGAPIKETLLMKKRIFG